MTKIGEISERMDVMAACPFEHMWQAESYRQYRGIGRRQGKRPHQVFATVLTPERCPECGHKACTWKPNRINDAAILTYLPTEEKPNEM